MIESFPAISASWSSRLKLAATTLAVASALIAPVRGVASPGVFTPNRAEVQAQNVDYISTEQGYSLDLGFTVLVPSWVPGPFGGSPSIDASGGYYSLYWMAGGGGPTFLQVEGVVGGGLPTGSPYDMNVQLSINATVNGYAAIHDVTPIYDAVWWIAGGVLYKVESQNAGSDSLSIANSLIPFEAPTYEEPEPEPEPTEPPAEEPVEEEPVEEQPAEEEPAAEESASEEPTDETTPETDAEDDAATEEPAESTEEPNVDDDGTGTSGVNSDGTGGASVPPAGDGTGGSGDVRGRAPGRINGEPNP